MSTGNRGGFPRGRGGGGGPVDTQLYDLLGVPPTATDDQITKAYHRLAKQYHPDKNPNHGDKFKEINAAYNILSDEQKRRIYDHAGLEGLDGSAGPSRLFSNMFGGHGGGRKRRRQKGDDTVQPLTVSLEDLYKGKTSKLQLTKNVICRDCSGRGEKGAVQACSPCRGTGRVMITRPVTLVIPPIQTRCDVCAGKGATVDKCGRCNGRKTVQEQKIIEVNITPGTRDNQEITLHAEGDQEPDIEPGDVILVVRTKPHEVFQRKDNDLIIKQKITLKEAICGFSASIQHLDNRKIILKTTPGVVIKPDSIHRVEGEGMPIIGEWTRGDLCVIFEIVFPDNHFLTEDGFKKLEALWPPRPVESLPIVGDDVEEVWLMTFDDSSHGDGKGANREA